jgi:hypothetical protein
LPGKAGPRPAAGHDGCCNAHEGPAVDRSLAAQARKSIKALAGGTVEDRHPRRTVYHHRGCMVLILLIVAID